MKNIIVEKLTRCLSEKQEILFAYLLGTFITREDFKDIDVGIYLDPQKYPEPIPFVTNWNWRLKWKAA
jgi:predicted nucleotidyltransferase